MIDKIEVGPSRLFFRREGGREEPVFVATTIDMSEINAKCGALQQNSPRSHITLAVYTAEMGPTVIPALPSCCYFT